MVTSHFLLLYCSWQRSQHFWPGRPFEDRLKPSHPREHCNTFVTTVLQKDPATSLFNKKKGLKYISWLFNCNLWLFVGWTASNSSVNLQNTDKREWQKKTWLINGQGAHTSDKTQWRRQRLVEEKKKATRLDLNKALLRWRLCCKSSGAEREERYCPHFVKIAHCPLCLVRKRRSNCWPHQPQAFSLRGKHFLHDLHLRVASNRRLELSGRKKKILNTLWGKKNKIK